MGESESVWVAVKKSVIMIRDEDIEKKVDQRTDGNLFLVM